MADQPNILFLMTDQQQGATIHPDSPCLTPNLDALAKEGFVFTRSYTCNAICSPTRASLMTGVLPHKHGMHDCTHVTSELHAKYDDTLPTFAQRLVDAGYQTAYYGKWHVERSGELDRFGWQQYDECGASYRDYREQQDLPLSPPYVSSRSLGGDGYRDTVLYGVTDEAVHHSRPYFVYSQAIEYLNQEAEADTPWCLFVSTSEPHDIYLAHEPFYKQYEPAELPQPASWLDNLSDKPRVLRRMQSVFDEMSWDEVAEATACYYASCSLIDAQVERIVEVLRRRGDLDNTIIIYTADHGDMMGAHGLFTKGVTPYEEVYHVPLLVRMPDGAQQGVVCDRVVSSCGLTPAILEWAGAEPLPEVHFRSLASLVEDVNDPDWEDIAFAEFYGQRYAFTQRLLWWDDWKLVMNAYADDELYDLSRDPGELHNLSSTPRYQSTKERLLRRLWTEVKRTGDTCMGNAHYWSLRFFDLGPNSAAETDALDDPSN
jgi:arylsulfatase A-like enzyme